MGDMEGVGNRVPDSGAGAPHVVLVASPDVLASVGKPGLLEERLAGKDIVRVAPRRSDVLLQDIKADSGDHIDGLPSPLVPHLASPFGSPDVRVAILSLLPDITISPPWRHRASGRMFQVDDGYLHQWPQQAVDQLHAGFDRMPALDVASSLSSMRRVIGILTDRGCQVIVFNVSTYDPTDRTHRFADVGDNYEIRAHRAIVALESIANEEGILVVDVDTAVAEVGAEANVPAAGRLRAAAAEFVTEEAIRAIDQSAAFDETAQAQVMVVRVPQFDRRTTQGVVKKWHIEPGDEVSDGDVMFEVRFERSVHRFDLEDAKSRVGSSHRVTRRRRHGVLKPLDVMVVAGGEVILRDVLVPEGAEVSVGTIAAVVTSSHTEHASVSDATADFRVGARVFES